MSSNLLAKKNNEKYIDNEVSADNPLVPSIMF